tara:strand:+ start:49 stop:345 length:297 start_codon:yes stop_codon:yes gene_type:complete
MFKTLPIEIYYKLINYGIYEPPHFIAYKTAKIRPIFNCELNSNITDNQILKLSPLTEFEDYPENDLDAEWLAFQENPMYYLQNQDLFTNSHFLNQYPS